MTRDEVLNAAKQCVCHDRNNQYGAPKVARIATGSGSQDNWIDLAGYAACGGEIEGKDNDPSIDRH